MKKKTKPFLIALIILMIIGYAGGVAIAYFAESLRIVDALQAWSYTLTGAGLGAVLAIVYAVMSKPKKEEKAKDKGKTAAGDEMKLSYDSKWLYPKDFDKEFGLILTNWASLP